MAKRRRDTENIHEKFKIEKGDPNYELINKIWLYASRQQEPSVQELDGLLAKLSDLLKEKQTSFTITPKEYVETLVVGDKTVVVGMDDYGQSYYFEWLEDGEVHQASCGTYNFEYKKEIEDFFASETELIKYSLRHTNDLLWKVIDDIRELKGGEKEDEDLGKGA